MTSTLIHQRLPLSDANSCTFHLLQYLDLAESAPARLLVGRLVYPEAVPGEVHESRSMPFCTFRSVHLVSRLSTHRVGFFAIEDNLGEAVQPDFYPKS